MYRQYAHDQMTAAYSAVMEFGHSVARAARIHAVPEQTLRDRVKDKIDLSVRSSGPDCLFSKHEEKKIVEFLKEQAAIGYGYTRNQVIFLASEFAIANKKRDPDHPLTTDWFRGFKSRWQELKLVKPSALVSIQQNIVPLKSLRIITMNLSQSLISMTSN